MHGLNDVFVIIVYNFKLTTWNIFLVDNCKTDIMHTLMNDTGNECSSRKSICLYKCMNCTDYAHFHVLFPSLTFYTTILINNPIFGFVLNLFLNWMSSFQIAVSAAINISSRLGMLLCHQKSEMGHLFIYREIVCGTRD